MAVLIGKSRDQLVDFFEFRFINNRKNRIHKATWLELQIWSNERFQKNIAIFFRDR